MRHQSGTRDKQVRLTVFDNEPMARMAEQHLRSEGIPSVVRSLQGGPGLWGSAYNLPHALYVLESDEVQARDLLNLPPLELAEREGRAARPRSGLRSNIALIVVVAVIAVILVLASPAFTGLFR